VERIEFFTKMKREIENARHGESKGSVAVRNKWKRDEGSDRGQGREGEEGKVAPSAPLRPD
jgi:hypothetical protein